MIVPCSSEASSHPVHRTQAPRECGALCSSHTHVVVMGARNSCDRPALRRLHNSPQLSEVLPSRHLIPMSHLSGASRSRIPPSDEHRHGGADTVHRAFDRFTPSCDETDRPIGPAVAQLVYINRTTVSHHSLRARGIASPEKRAQFRENFPLERGMGGVAAGRPGAPDGSSWELGGSSGAAGAAKLISR